MEAPPNEWDAAANALSLSAFSTSSNDGTSISGPFPSARGPYILVSCVDLQGCERLLAQLLHGALEAGFTRKPVVVPFGSRAPCISAVDDRPLAAAYIFPSREAVSMVLSRIVPNVALKDLPTWCVDSGPVTGQIDSEHIVPLLQQGMTAHASLRLLAQLHLPAPLLAQQTMQGPAFILGELHSPDAPTLKLAESMERLRLLTVELAEYVEYAFITVQGVGQLVAEHIRGRGQVGLDLVRFQPSELAHDAYWFQILGPSHLKRLGHPLRDVVPLVDGRVGLSFGRANAWVTAHPQLDQPRSVLAPLFQPSIR